MEFKPRSRQHRNRSWLEGRRLNSRGRKNDEEDGSNKLASCHGGIGEHEDSGNTPECGTYGVYMGGGKGET